MAAPGNWMKDPEQGEQFYCQPASRTSFCKESCGSGHGVRSLLQQRMAATYSSDVGWLDDVGATAA